MRTSNPALNDNSFSGKELDSSKSMTLGGTVFKTGLLLLCLLVGFGYTWDIATASYASEFEQVAQNTELPTQISIPPSVYGYTSAGIFGGLIVGMVIIFNPPTAPYLSPIYAFLEGLSLGAISAGFEAKYPGIAAQAAAGTFGTLFGLLAVYSTGLIKASENFKLGLIAAMFGILILYLADLIMQMCGMGYVSVVHDSSPVSIGLSCFIVLVAALNLVLDFDFIENGVGRAPKYMEWYGAFGIMVTLVWLYLEIIRLLAKLKAND